MYDVSVVPCPSYDPAVCRAALEAVLAPLGGLDWVRPGMRIAVKANLVTAMRPEKAATTHPVLLAELTKLLTARGASVVIGDSPSGLYTPAALQAVYHAAGLSLAEEAGAVLNRDCSQAEAVFPEARVAKTFQYTAWLDGADAVLDFCKLKSHGMMGLSAAAKNLFGTIPGTMKPEYHFRYPDPADFARMLVDLAEYWRPRLCLVDAVVAMEGNGPTAGTPRPLGALLAGVSPHRVDLACAALIGLGPNRVPTLAAARERGLIPASAAELSVSGSLAALGAPDFRTVSAPAATSSQTACPGRWAEPGAASSAHCSPPGPRSTPASASAAASARPSARPRPSPCGSGCRISTGAAASAASAARSSAPRGPCASGARRWRGC